VHAVDKIPTKVVYIHSDQAIDQFVEDFHRLHREGRVKQFVCMYSTDRSEADGGGRDTYFHWFGDTTCVYVLGMIEWVKEHVLEYMRKDQGLE